MYFNRKARFFVLALILMLSAVLVGTLLAAEPTAALVGNTSIVASAGTQGIQEFSIWVDVSGSVPKKPNNPPKIWVCDVDTLHADGSLSCDHVVEITLVAGHNYTLNKTDSNGNTFPMYIPKTINIDADVPCGVTYNVYEVVTSQEGAGVSFAGGVHRVELPFTIEVTCPPPPQGQWCSPGYWKQDQHFDSWVGYSPGDDFDTVFGVTYFNPDITLLTSLGGNNVGANELSRQGTSALLSAANPNVNYPLTEAQVIALVQAGDAAALKAISDAIVAELGSAHCPLN